MIEFFNENCMTVMARYPDNHFHLACVDPPYGINHAEIAGKQSGKQYGKAAAPKANYEAKDWDNSPPDSAYFKELFRVSKNQIIWGANYMTDNLPPSSGWVFWDKDNGTNNFSDGELAYTSFNRGLRKIKYTWNGMIQADMKNKEIRIHPCQKPMRLYQWLLDNYAKKGQRILDTHGGSFSSAIAAHYFGADMVICEIDEDYFKAGKERFERETKQIAMF